MKTIYKNFIINSTYKGDKPAEWGKIHNCNNHRITVMNTENGKRTSFDFWASLANPEIKTDNDNISAFGCFLSDATAGEYDFDTFCNEFGYDSPSKAYHTWKECQKATNKAKRLIGDMDKLYDVYNDILELGL